VDQALQQGDFERAATLATNPMQRGIAAYRQGHYDEATVAFAQVPGARAHYNRGNALAHLNRFEEALAAYDAALAEDPGMQDAKENRDLVEKLLRQQRQIQQKDSKKDGEQENKPQQSQGQQGNQQVQRQAQSKPTQTNNDTQRTSSDSQTSSNDQQPSEATQSPLNDSQTPPDTPKKQTHRATTNQVKQQTTEQQDPGHNAALAKTEEDLSHGEGQQMMEQWLRRIPDDPGGLLREKFLRQYQHRGEQRTGQSQEAW
jgi:Ca-activated chloride channel family protein